MTRNRWVFALAVVGGLAAAGAAPVGLSRADDDLDPGLSSRLRKIETAFRDGDANSLRSSCSTTGKVRVDLHDIPEGQGSYGPGQLQVVFTRIFDEFRTREFAFAREDVTTSGSGTTFARGRWVRRGAHSQDLSGTLTFTLRAESGDWRISEIRSSR